MKTAITWVVTFDGARVRAFEWHKANRALAAIALGVDAGEQHPMFRDRPVRGHASVGPSRGVGDPKSDAERNLEERFVDAVTAALALFAKRRAFDHLIIAAAPRALGYFRAHASPDLLAMVDAQIDHDYVNTPTDALLRAIEDKATP